MSSVVTHRVEPTEPAARNAPHEQGPPSHPSRHPSTGALHSMTVHHRAPPRRSRSRSTTSATPRTSSPRSTRPSSTSTTATSSRAPSSRSTATRSCSTSATRPRASSPPASCPSSTTSTPTRSSSVGDEVEALVLQKEDKEGRLILSKKRAQYERAWGTIEKIKEEDGVVTGTVIEVVKGGLILDIGLRGFLPASLVEMRRVRDLQPYVGKELEAKIIELDKNRNNVVLSRRAWLEQTQSEVRQNFLTQLQKGQIRSGVVSSIVNFGAFVDLGGVDGLVHVSELSWKHIDHPSEVVEVGNEVTVEVLDVDMDRERVSLSLKATQEDPWQQFARTHQIGQVVPGKVTKLVPFGAFVRVDEGIEGLVHISELAERHVELPEQVVTGRRRHLRQGHRHRPRASPHLAVAQAGQRGHLRRRRRALRPGALRHGRRRTTRPATTSTPRASTRRPASGSRATRPRRPSGSGSTPRRTRAGRRTRSRSRSSARPTPRPASPSAAESGASVLHLARPGGRGHPRDRRGPAGAARQAHRRLSIRSQRRP